MPSGGGRSEWCRSGLSLDSVLLHVLLVALLAIWCGVEIIGFDSLGTWFFGRWRYVPNGTYSLALFVLVGLAWAYRRRSVAVVWLYVPLLAWWAILQPFAWEAGELGLFYCGIVAGLLLIIAESHLPGSRFASPYRELGVVLTAVPLLVLVFPKQTRGSSATKCSARMYIRSSDMPRRSCLPCSRWR